MWNIFGNELDLVLYVLYFMLWAVGGWVIGYKLGKRSKRPHK